MTAPRKRILLVDNDRFLRRACEASLQKRGFDVVSATDGEEGLRLVKSDRFDLVLLDLLMPKKPGIEVLAELRAEAAPICDLPVVILSNSSREEDKHRAAALGAVGYYVKANLSLQALGDEIARLLGVTV
jgi:CheY-like chemotaxis protein